MMYFISYDIADSKRLHRVAKTLENFGVRVQYSFFQCEMEKIHLEDLRGQLLDIIDLKKDSLKIYPLCEDCLKKISTIGEGDCFVPETYIIL